MNDKTFFLKVRDLCRDIQNRSPGATVQEQQEVIKGLREILDGPLFYAYSKKK